MKWTIITLLKWSRFHTITKPSIPLISVIIGCLVAINRGCSVLKIQTSTTVRASDQLVSHHSKCPFCVCK